MNIVRKPEVMKNAWKSERGATFRLIKPENLKIPTVESQAHSKNVQEKSP